MVNFNEVRICDNRTKLVIDCSVQNSQLYSRMYIDTIYLDYYENVDSSGLPSNKAVKVWETDTGEKLKTKRVIVAESFLEETGWHINSFKDGLFFVIVVCDGVPAPEAGSVLPCGFDDTVNVAAVPDWESFYGRGMQLISSLFGKCKSKCELPAGFEQFVLLWEAFKLAVAVCDWSLASDIWKQMIMVRSGVSSVASACGCGR